MKHLLFLGFVALCQGYAIKTSKELPRPVLLGLTVMEQNGLSLEAEWRPVEHDDPSEPILGYKLMVWEQKPVTTYKYETIDRVTTVVEEEVAPRIFTPPPESEAKVIVVEGPLSTSGKVLNIEVNVIYEVRVRAFSALRDGPVSSFIRVQLFGNKKDDNETGNDMNQLV